MTLKEVIHGKVDIQIGKKGIDTGVVQQITEVFKNRKFLKIRFLDLTGFDGIKKAAEVLASQTRSAVVDTRGKTCVLKKKPQPKN